MGQNNFVTPVLMKSVCVVAVYTVCMLTLLSCWAGIHIPGQHDSSFLHLLVIVHNNKKC